MKHSSKLQGGVKSSQTINAKKMQKICRKIQKSKDSGIYIDYGFTRAEVIYLRLYGYRVKFYYTGSGIEWGN